jgi:hypothetical protein
MDIWLLERLAPIRSDFPLTSPGWSQLHFEVDL